MAEVREIPSAPEARPVRVGLLGCGTVGSALVGLIVNDRAAIAARSGLDLEVRRVAVRDNTADRGLHLDPGVWTTDAEVVVNDPDVDVVVELIGGIEPARSLIRRALAAGKPVVSANKELLASHGAELEANARAAGVPLLFEAAVAGAIPLLRALRVSLAGEPVRRVMGIVNGTTNFILSAMTESHLSYTEALAEAQRLGFAERDPAADVEGYDAAAKAAILAGIAFDATVVSDQVYREGIERIESSDIEFAGRLGYVVKLLAVAEDTTEPGATERSIAVRVHPAMVPVEHPLAGVRGSYNAVFVEGAYAGELMFYGRGAGGLPTASAVLGDLIDALGGHPLGHGGVRRAVSIRPIDELRAQYYLTIDVADRPGVLSSVAALFGEHRVSIRSMEQVGLADEARLVFITHIAKEADVQATLEGLRGLEAVERVGSVLRVIGPEQ
jgi:homoserine dehydrogenase